MYDAQVSALAIERGAAAINAELAKRGLPADFTPTYHSIAQVERNLDYFADLLNPETGQPKRELQADEARWVRNERLLCTADFCYWAERYAVILAHTEGGQQLRRFVPNVAQRIIWDIHAEMERQGIAIGIDELKARRLGVCLHPETRTLTSDLRWITLEDLRIGQTIVSVDEHPAAGRGKGRKLRQAMVLSKRTVYEPAFRLTMDNGETLIATGPHRFLWFHPERRAWRKVSEISVGDKLRWITRPWSEPDYEDGWFGGLLDGEGSLRARPKEGGVEICASQILNAVHRRAAKYLSSRGYSFHIEIDEHERARPDGCKRQPLAKLVVNRINEVFRLVGQTRPSRFVEQPWWKGRELPGKRSGEGWSTVAAIEALGPLRMIDLETSTGTFIAEGFVSHNSTDTELKVAHRVQFYPNVTAVVASSDPGKTAKLTQMIERAWRHQPWYLMPKMTGYQKGECISFGELDSHLILQWGNQQTGIARGDAPTVIHLSEVAEWQNPEELIDAAPLKAIIWTPDIFLILEGTARGRHNWWHKEWEYAKRHWEDGTSTLRPVFLPYFAGTDIYPSPAWLRAHPIPRNWRPEGTTVAHAERARAYTSSNALLRRYLGSDWEMPRQQMWWWEATRAEHKEKGQLGIFQQELCADDLECFVASGVSVIDAEVIGYYRERARKPLGVFGIQGPPAIIHPKLQPNKRQIDPDAPNLRIDEHFTLVPLRFGMENSPDGKLLIWEMPEATERYGLGVDPSRGIGSDNAAIEVLKKARAGRNDAQVAELVSGQLDAVALAPFAYVVGRFYSPKHEGVSRHAKMVIEIEGGGNLTQKELRLKYGWPVSSFHRWMRAYDQRVLDRSKSQQLGWSTNRWSRDELILTLLDALRNGLVDINSPWFCDEMGDLEAEENTQKIKAQRGAWDDRIMALGMVLFSLHDLDRAPRGAPAGLNRAHAARELGEQEDQEAAPMWRPGAQARGEAARIWTPPTFALREEEY